MFLIILPLSLRLIVYFKKYCGKNLILYCKNATKNEKKSECGRKQEEAVSQKASKSDGKEASEEFKEFRWIQNLLSTSSDARKNEKSVMTSIDQEPTEQPTLTRKGSVAAKEPVMKTMMMAPTVQAAPLLAPGAPRPPPNANPMLLTQNPPQNPQNPVTGVPQATTTRPATDPDPNMRKLSRERDVSVDEGDSSDKR